MSKWAKKGDDKRLRGRAGVARSLRVKAKANYQCQKCDKLTPELEADHIIPLCLGGKDDESNMQALCIDCHREKSAGEALDALRLASGKKLVYIDEEGWPT